ncbi:hypothetical protein EAE96_005211 [Botrytis aclada]|nr:hypothetical protein EAE96_005211 [Botrytis aclada]
MVQYPHFRSGSKPQKRVVAYKALAKLFPRSIYERHRKLFVARPVDPQSICLTNLPLEIRLMIWRACFESRVVTICARPGRDSLYHPYQPYQPVATIASVHATMPITLSINRESRFETLRSYPDLIQNPAFFPDPVYFNPKLDKLAIHVLHQDYYRASLPQRYYRDDLWRVMSKQCLCDAFYTLIDIASCSPSMSKMVRFFISRQGSICWRCKSYKNVMRSYFALMEKFHELKTVVHQSPRAKKTMVLNNISKEGSWTLDKPAWKAIKSRKNFENDNWRIRRTDKHNVASLHKKSAMEDVKNMFKGLFVI